MGEAFETLKTEVLHLLQRKHLVILRTGHVHPAGNESPTEGLGFRLPRPLGDVTSQHSLAPSWGGCSLAWPGSALGTEWQTRGPGRTSRLQVGPGTAAWPHVVASAPF